MPLTQEEVKELKVQLMEQVQHLPPEQKKQAQAQIESMSSEALESLLKQQSPSNNKSIFRLIVDKEIDSIILAENQESIAVLDINPISEGHTLIIPKLPCNIAEKIPKSAFALAKEISNKIISNLKAKTTKIETDIQFGEAIIHLIPIYKEDLNKKSPRKKSDIKNLSQIKQSLETIKIENKVEKIKIEKLSKSAALKINRRIP